MLEKSMLEKLSVVALRSSFERFQVFAEDYFVEKYGEYDSEVFSEVCAERFGGSNLADIWCGVHHIDLEVFSVGEWSLQAYLPEVFVELSVEDVSELSRLVRSFAECFPGGGKVILSSDVGFMGDRFEVDVFECRRFSRYRFDLMASMSSLCKSVVCQVLDMMARREGKVLLSERAGFIQSGLGKVLSRFFGKGVFFGKVSFC